MKGADEFRTSRARNACAQLTRYGNDVCTAEIADVLELLADINDHVAHGRDVADLETLVGQAKACLDKILQAERWAYVRAK